MLSEFSLIDRFFARRARGARTADDGSLGIGDDCALLAPRPGEMLAISTDMLVEGRHFFPDIDPHSLGHKALAVNLSDLAAMGAKPQAFTLVQALGDGFGIYGHRARSLTGQFHAACFFPPSNRVATPRRHGHRSRPAATLAPARPGGGSV